MCRAIRHPRVDGTMPHILLCAHEGGTKKRTKKKNRKRIDMNEKSAATISLNRKSTRGHKNFLSISVVDFFLLVCFIICCFFHCRLTPWPRSSERPRARAFATRLWNCEWVFDCIFRAIKRFQFYDILDSFRTAQWQWQWAVAATTTTGATNIIIALELNAERSSSVGY